MQGRNEHLLAVTDKLCGFQLKLALWQEKFKQGVLEMFFLAVADQAGMGLT